MKYDFDEIISRENTNSLKWDCCEVFFEKNDIIPLWVADMDFKTPDFVIDAIRKRAEHEIMAYTFRADSFFESARDWLYRRNGWQIDIKSMAYAPGVVPALNFAVESLTNPNDKIVIQTPVYPPFFNAVTDNGRTLVENPLIEKNGYYTIDFDNLEQKLADDAKMFIFCNPHNPVGRVWNKSELSRIAELCVKYNVKLISDEIHSDLIFKHNKHTYIASLSDEIAQLTLTCIAPSKTFNLAGFATAIVHSLNSDILSTFNKRIERYHIGMGNIFGNVAFEAAYKYGDEWLNQLLEYLDDNAEWVCNYLNENIPIVKACKPEGTYLMWLDFRELNMGVKELRNFLIHNAGIGLNDGFTFGKGGIGFMRLNIACSRTILKKALLQLKQAIDNKFN